MNENDFLRTGGDEPSNIASKEFALPLRRRQAAAAACVFVMVDTDSETVGWMVWCLGDRFRCLRGGVELGGDGTKLLVEKSFFSSFDRDPEVFTVQSFILLG